jgi:hypothetical protein
MAIAACAGVHGPEPAHRADVRPVPDAAALVDASEQAQSAALDAGAEEREAEAEAAAVEAAPPPSPLVAMFDGDPEGGPVSLVQSRCAPACLRFPKGWLATDDGGMVYAWFFRGEGQFTTAEVMRCPLPKLEESKLAVLLRFAGGDRVTWSPPVEGAVGKDHTRALIAEGTGTARGRKAHFWMLHVDLGKRKDLVIAWVADGEPEARADEVKAVVRSVSAVDGVPQPR